VTERPYIELAADVEADRLDVESDDAWTCSWADEWIDPRLEQDIEEDEET
jgi:hypothetical protein